MTQTLRVFQYKNIFLIGISSHKYFRFKNVWQGIIALSAIVPKSRKRQIVLFVYGPMTKQNFMIDNRSHKAQIYGQFEWMSSLIELHARLQKRKKYTKITQDVLDILSLLPIKDSIASGDWRDSRIYTIHINSLFCRFCSQQFWSTIIHELLHARAFMKEQIKTNKRGIRIIHKNIENYVHIMSEQEFLNEENKMFEKLCKTIEENKRNRTRN